MRVRSHVFASAADNVGVARVELYVDSVLRSTRLTGPYTFAVDLAPLAAGTHNAQVRAWDAAGNSASSNTVRFKR